MMDEVMSGKIRKYFEYLLDNSTAEEPMWNLEKFIYGVPNKWNYIDGCMITAVLSLYEMFGDEKYFRFAKDFVDYFVQDDGVIRTFDVEEYNLDNINASRNLFFIYEKTHEEKYRKAIEQTRSQLETMPRTKEGNFWHKLIYPNQVWLDGLYMAQPFYMQYETVFNGMEKCLDSIHQFENVVKFMRDEKTGLYYHGYDSSREMFWADPVTGCSKNFWLRAIGWYTMSLVDTASVISETLYNEFRFLQKTLTDLVEALIPWQDESGMFYQVVNAPDAEGNYLETSGTALVASAILKGVRLGYLPEKYAVIGEKAFNGIVDRYLKIDDDGKIELGGICLVGGLGGRQMRDGTLEYYFSEPVVKNEAKGVAPFLLAYTEMLRRNKK